MRGGTLLSGVVRVGLVAAAVTACAADEGDSDDWDERYDVAGISIAGRWNPSAGATAAGDRQYVRYDDAPSWSGGRYCGGSLLAGTRELGDYLVRAFRGASRYDGYVCRANTANTSQTSMHGTGRALDVYIPTSRGAADNTLGDEVANWLIANAGVLGVQLVIWDRSSWNATRVAGDKLRGYGGPHPHHDHIHVELNADGAARRTAWFRDRSVARSPSGGAAPAPAPAPSPSPSPSPAPPPTTSAARFKVTAYALNLRAGPGTGYGVVTTMPCGSAVTQIAGPVSGWYGVDYGGRRGWASGSYLVPEASFRASVCAF